MSENSKVANEAIAGEEDRVVVYGSVECPFTVRVRKWLDAWDVPYRWVDVETNPGAERQIANWNEGRAILPTLDVGGAIFINPEQSVLHGELKARGLL